MAQRFDTLNGLNEFATTEKEMDAVRFVMKNDATFSRAMT